MTCHLFLLTAQTIHCLNKPFPGCFSCPTKHLMTQVASKVCNSISSVGITSRAQTVSVMLSSRAFPVAVRWVCGFKSREKVFMFSHRRSVLMFHLVWLHLISMQAHLLVRCPFVRQGKGRWETTWGKGVTEAKINGGTERLPSDWQPAGEYVWMWEKMPSTAGLWLYNMYACNVDVCLWNNTICRAWAVCPWKTDMSADK